MPRVTRAELARLDAVGRGEQLPRGWTRLYPLPTQPKSVEGRPPPPRPRRPRPPLEREIQRAVLNYLNAVPGIYAWKAGAGLLPLADGRRVRMGRAGVSDVIGWFRVHRVSVQPWQRCGMQRCERQHIPVWFAIECKRPGGKATPAQLDFLARLREAGSPLAMVASSVDEVRRAVEAL